MRERQKKKNQPTLAVTTELANFLYLIQLKALFGYGFTPAGSRLDYPANLACRNPYPILPLVRRRSHLFHFFRLVRSRFKLSRVYRICSCKHASPRTHLTIGLS